MTLLKIISTLELIITLLSYGGIIYATCRSYWRSRHAVSML